MLVIEKGSDLDFRLIWPGECGFPMDLTDWSVSLRDVHSDLASNIEVDIDDPTKGSITVHIEWDEDYRYGRRMKFRIQITSSDSQRTTPHIEVKVV